MTTRRKDPRRPPKWADQFLKWYCADHLLDEIQGDLYEAHHHRSKEYGMRRAGWWFVWDVIRFFRPSSINKKSQHSNFIAMHRNYLKITFRNFTRHKVYSSINLSGLVVGIVSCLLISLHVLEELSYDRFHPDPFDKYRVVMDMYNNGDELSAHSAPVYAAVGPNIREDFPEVKDQLRILPFGSGVYSVKSPSGSLIRYNEENAVFADPNFFTMFGFELLAGDPGSVLSEPHQTVLSQSTATRYFGDENPIGKPIYYRGTQEYIVTGVMKDFPENSHLQFDLISSLNSWDGYEQWPQNWGWYDFYTYIYLEKGTNGEAFGKKIEGYLQEKNPDEYKETGSRDILILQNLPDIHLYSKGLSWEMGDNGGAEKVYFLAIIAGLILIIAWVNFINLSTARAVKRAREVGIRKVVGAKKSVLIGQFMTEAFLYNLFSVILGMAIVFLLIQPVNVLLGISLERELLLAPPLLIGVILLITMGTIISGLYPSIVLTSFKPINVLKGNFYNRKSKFGFRQVLVILQFTISVVLILGTFMVVKQLQYMQSRDLGLNVDRTLVIKAPSASRGQDDLPERKLVFESRLGAIPQITGFTASNVVPGVENFSISNFTTRLIDEYRDCYRVRVDENYFPDFEIPVLEGRNFIQDMVSDSNSVILNEEAVKLFGFPSYAAAIGEKLNPGSRYEWKIIGICSNYHHSSLKESLDPIIFSYRPRSGSFFSLKVQGNIPETIGAVQNIWDDIYPDNPFDYFFLDEFFNQQYRNDRQFNAVFNGFAGLAIFVACLGLFGLVSFTAEQSRKEIGIRKVLGASVVRIILLFAKDYALLIGISFAISFPVGYYLMDQWLADFAYRTQIEPIIFVMGGLAIIIIAFLTVGAKSLDAARSNPVEALREE